MRKIWTTFKDQSAAVSVEFVIIISFYIFTVTTLFTAVDVFLAANKGYKGNAIVSNVSSRLNEMDANEMDNLFVLFQNAASVGEDDAWLRLTSVRNNQGTFEVNWSVSTAGKTNCLTDDDPKIALFVPNVANGDEVLLLETSLDYTPLFGSTAFGQMTFNQRSTYIPRFVPQMTFPGFNLEEDCTEPLDLTTDEDAGATLEPEPTEPTEEVIDADADEEV